MLEIPFELGQRRLGFFDEGDSAGTTAQRFDAERTTTGEQVEYVAAFEIEAAMKNAEQRSFDPIRGWTHVEAGQRPQSASFGTAGNDAHQLKRIFES
jgi:hypothetical protein